MTPATIPDVEIDYPSSDGKPMAETHLHVQAIILLQQALEDFFRDRSDVFVASDIFWYQEPGGVGVAPDVMVVPGVRPRPAAERRSFYTWEEGGAVPAAVFEIASKGTWQEDVEEKYDDYARRGVAEYFLFDPEGVYIGTAPQGYRLNGSVYRRIWYTPVGEVESRLGFRMRSEGGMLRLIDGRTGQPIPTRAEAVEAAEAAASAERRRADTEKLRADAAEAAEAAEKLRADALAAEVERLKALLGGNPP